MGARLRTDYGTINLSKNIYYDIIRSAVEATHGRARFGNAGLFLSFLINDESNCMKLKFDEDNVTIDVYIIVRFGSSISRIADGILEHINGECITNFGKKPALTTIYVTGVESIRGTIRRTIEFKREG